MKLLAKRNRKNVHPFTVLVKVDSISSLQGEPITPGTQFEIAWRRGDHSGASPLLSITNGELHPNIIFKIPCNFKKESGHDDLASKRLIVYLKKIEKKRAVKIAVLQIDLALIVNKDDNTKSRQYSSTMKGIDNDKFNPYIEFYASAQPGITDGGGNLSASQKELESMSNSGGSLELSSNILSSDRRNSVSTVSSDQMSDVSFSNIQESKDPLHDDPFEFNFESEAPASNHLTREEKKTDFISPPSTRSTHTQETTTGNVQVPPSITVSSMSAPLPSPLRGNSAENLPTSSNPFDVSPINSPIPPNSPMPERRMSTDDHGMSKKQQKQAKKKGGDRLITSIHKDHGFFSRRRHSIAAPSQDKKEENENRTMLTDRLNEADLPLNSVLFSRTGDERLKFLNEEMILYKRPEYSQGIPLSSIIVYKCLFEWKDFSPHNHICLENILKSFDYLGSMENMDKETSCYWLSTSYGLHYLLDCSYNLRANAKKRDDERSPTSDLATNTEAQNIKLFMNKLQANQKQFWRLLWRKMHAELDTVLNKIVEVISDKNFVQTDLYLNYLRGTLDFLEKRVPFSSLWPNIFKQIFYYTSGFFCNLFLMDTVHSNSTCAINLKLLLSSLAQWIQENKKQNYFYYFKIEMSVINQLLDVMIVDKNSLKEEAVRKEVCPSLRLNQLAILLATFNSLSCQEEVDPDVIKFLQDKGIKNQEEQDSSINTDIMFDLPDNPEPSKKFFEAKIPQASVSNKRFKFIFKPTTVY
ncbi:hypothetical protein SAMD00019534_064170 [Acytostelium subglobosum LB1]|uniref:hypothetical protein n=1 Tax=Acytostelium subglobosum LB1 TaxID=1410327 RepID=UPI000644E5DF|nr:hypothetical protein SAMD00019534_064170 [Acytostelium subglobosum LB1]GAM23242.1 hypothetical protein SAMD00019534_064170 [Acytostelium subglobosum LB1]|eukprot:XP_012753691.1 hypothetical protein SAMD00019534_064170 [Acytostelium subglobosum LB1]